MASINNRWESDPLFSAAEVVQDSADRMESIYRLLLHEQGLVHGDRPEPRLLTSIDYHRRHLATILETTKWQLEDFERAVSVSAMVDNSQTLEVLTTRHKQFIRAIREQINQVEERLEEPSLGKSIRNSEWVNLNEKDRDGLALFLSGGLPTEDSKAFRSFLDQTIRSASKEDEIIEHECGQNKDTNMNGIAHFDNLHGSVNENNLRKVSSHHSVRLDSAVIGSPPEASCNRKNDESWDLEANEPRHKTFFHENNLRQQINGTNIYRHLSDIWNIYWSRANRDYTKRLKDGEEEREASSQNDVSLAGQGRRMVVSLASRDNLFNRFCSAFFTQAIHLCNRTQVSLHQRFPYHFPVNQYNMKMLTAVVFTLTVLVILVCQIG